MKCFIMFGPPGAGKGTHAGAVAEKFNLKHVSTGELLRAEIAEGTELGKYAKSLIDKGNLVPDSVVEGMIENVFNKKTQYDGYLLDGFPRTISQAEDLDKILAKKGDCVTAVIGLMISDETVRARIKKRAAIEGRADDADDSIISNRIKTYHSQTEPLIEYYTKAGKYYGAVVEEPTIEANKNIILDLVKDL